MANKNEKKIDPALLDELLKNQDAQTVFWSEGLLGDLKKGLAERMLDAEMDPAVKTSRRPAIIVDRPP